MTPITANSDNAFNENNHPDLGDQEHWKITYNSNFITFDKFFNTHKTDNVIKKIYAQN